MWSTERFISNACTMLNLRSVDLNLLPVFEAAYEEATLSRAADRLAMTQSAVSHALSRLRALFGDELFVRHGRGVVATPVADALYAELRDALATVRNSVTESRGFDPKTSERSFFVSVSHPLGPLVAVALREQLRLVAPGLQVAFTTRSRPIELERALREGRVDAAVDWVIPAGGSFNETTLFEDALVAVARAGHTALKSVRTVESLKELDFVTLRRRTEGGAPVAGVQDWLRLELSFVLEVSEILEVLMVSSHSDLVTLIPRSMLPMARKNFDLRPIRVTVTTETIPVSLVWPVGKDKDAAHKFLRGQIGMACRSVVGRTAR